MSVWEDFRCKPRRLAESDTAVLALVDMQARGRVSRVVLRDEFWLVFQFDAERIVRFGVYPDAEEARSAAGIT